MEQTEINELIEKYLQGISSQEEEEKLLHWYRSVDHSYVEVPVNNELEPQEIKARMLSHLRGYIGSKNKKTAKRIRIFYKVAAAAIIILMAGSGVYLLFFDKPDKQMAKKEINQPVNDDLAPGGNKAILTLADGSTITLDNAKNGLLSEQGRTSILKVSDGQLAYNSVAGNDDEVLINTISTPNGGQYMVVLSDGTKVWLNATSSLRFPTKFIGNERRVLLNGEGYFDVVHNQKQPFIVSTDNMEVKDLGTEFNVNVYNNEPAKTITLVTGSAAVKSNGEEIMLHPGKVVTVIADHNMVSDADVAATIAWKNGIFQFNDASIETIMRQVARWYNVEVEYKGKIPQLFSGSIYRNSKASEVFKILEENGSVRFSIEDKKIVVMPNH